MKVAVVGCGYVGLISGVGLASVGHEVVGIEVDDHRRGVIASGVPPFHEPGLPELLTSMLAAGAFRVDRSISAVDEADVILLAVQTPPRPDGSNDTSYLVAAAEAVSTRLAAVPPKRRVVAVRSTVVPGTVARAISPLFEGGDVAVASNPEFLREGSAVADYLEPDRIVVGSDEPWGREMLTALYGPFDAPMVVTGATAAELTKYASNAFLATVVSFANEIARISQRLPGVDVEDVLGALHLDRRLRDPVTGATAQLVSYLKAGCGYGGSCLPKDVAALVSRSMELGHEPSLLRAVESINRSQPEELVGLLQDAVGDLRQRRVTLLGLAFKGGTDDIRESPGLKVLDLLLAEGCEVTVHDPLVAPESVAGYLARGVSYAGTLLASVVGADACIVASSAPEFTELETLVRGLDPAPLVVDGRRFLTPDRFPRDGYVAIGLGAAVPARVSAHA